MRGTRTCGGHAHAGKKEVTNKNVELVRFFLDWFIEKRINYQTINLVLHHTILLN